MRNRIGYTICLASILAAILFPGCGKDIYYNNTTYRTNNIIKDDEPDTPPKNLIYLVVSRYGLGDNGVQDLIFEGITKSLRENDNITLEWQEMSGSKESDASKIKKWLSESSLPDLRQRINKRLLILPDDKYMELLKEDPSIKPDDITDILVMETSDTSRSDIYTRYISPYASYFLVSRMINDECLYLESKIRIKCIAPNHESEYSADAIKGLKDGFLTDYFSFMESEPTITYLSGPENMQQDKYEAISSGFDKDEAAFQWCENGNRDTLGTFTRSLFSQSEMQVMNNKKRVDGHQELLTTLYTAFIPTAGFSNTGISQFFDKMTMNFIYRDFWLIGMDKQEASGIYNLTTIRRYDLMIYDFISHWVNGDRQSKNKIAFYGEYEYLLTNDQSTDLKSLPNNYYIDEAIKYEHEYFSKK